MDKLKKEGRKVWFVVSVNQRRAGNRTLYVKEIVQESEVEKLYGEYDCN